MKITDIIEYFDEIAPVSRGADWDNDGVMLSCENDIKKVLITLDITSQAVETAIKSGVQLIISHHPFIFRPINRIGDDILSENIKKLIKHNISVLSYHTRMDASDAGINQYILEKLELESITPFGLDENDMTGRIGNLTAPISMEQLSQRIKELFKCEYFTCSKFCGEIKRIAVVSGSGGEYMDCARKNGADVFISGEFKHHQYINSEQIGFPIVSVDHYHCENVFVELIYDIISKRFTELEIIKNLGNAPFITVR